MVGSDAGSCSTSGALVLSCFRCARFSSFILRFSMPFISFWRFWNVVVISLSSQHSAARAQAPAVQPIHGKGKLPARFARLARWCTVIFVRKPAAPAATLAASATTSGPASSTRPPKTLWAAWRAAFALRARFVHFQIAPANFFSIQGSHGRRRFRVVGHFDECKTTRAAGFPVHGHVNARYLAKRGKQLAQFALRGLEAHVAHK